MNLITNYHKPFMFSTTGTPGRGYNLVVYARSEKAAREYAKGSCKGLRFISAGTPGNPEFWAAGIAP